MSDLLFLAVVKQIICPQYRKHWQST